MNNNKKTDNVRPYKSKNTTPPTPEEPVQPSFLSQLFREPSDSDPVERKKARDARFRGIKSNNTPPSGSFTK